MMASDSGVSKADDFRDLARQGTPTAEDMIFLKARFEIRWDNLINSSLRHKAALPAALDKEKVWQRLLDRFKNGFVCAYCGQLLLIRDSLRPFSKSFSLDHKISLFSGGGNDADNIEIICHRCNIIKGTISPSTFTELIKACPSSLLDRMFTEMLPGRLKEKLVREESL